MEEQVIQTKNNIKPEVLELLTEEERESLEEFNSMGIDVNQYSNYSSTEDASDDSSDDELDEEMVEESNPNSSLTSNTTINDNVLKETDQNLDDMFSDF